MHPHPPENRVAPTSRTGCALKGARNLLIGAILLGLTVDTLPAVPNRIRQALLPPLKLLGIDQGKWSMFDPEPDRQNHRISAVVYYADGSERTWRPPDWREQSRRERFLTHRQSKYCENIANPGFLSALPPLAHWIVRELENQSDPPRAKPVRVEFWIEDGPIPDHHYFPWPNVQERAPWETRWQFGDYDFSQEAVQ